MQGLVADTTYFGESMTYDGNTVVGQAEALEQVFDGDEAREVRRFWFSKADIAEPTQRTVIVYDSVTYYVKGDEWGLEGGLYWIWTYRSDRRAVL